MIYLSRFEKISEPEKSEYPFTAQVIRAFSVLTLTEPITILCGENGSGKTTLLELMAEQCGANRVSSPGALSQSGEAIKRAARYFRAGRTAKPRTTILFSAEAFTRYIEFLRAEKREAQEELQRVAARYGDAARPYAVQPFQHTIGEIEGMYANDLSAQSHGQGFLDFFASRIHPGGLYFIDEPEAALSYANQLALLYIMRDATADGAQFVLASHSPVIAACPDAKLYELCDGVLTQTRYDNLTSISFLKHWLARHDDFFRDGREDGADDDT